MLYQDLPVFGEVYALTVKVFTVTQDFPREYKFESPWVLFLVFYEGTGWSLRLL